MKEIEKYFNIYKKTYPDLTSFMWFGKACKQCKPSKTEILDAMPEFVERKDYSKSDIVQIIEHFVRMAK